VVWGGEAVPFAGAELLFTIDDTAEPWEVLAPAEPYSLLLPGVNGLAGLPGASEDVCACWRVVLGVVCSLFLGGRVDCGLAETLRQMATTSAETSRSGARVLRIRRICLAVTSGIFLLWQMSV